MGLVRISDTAHQKLSELKGELGIGQFVEMLIDNYEANSELLGEAPATKAQAEEIIRMLNNMPEKKSDLATPKEIKETGGLKPVRTRFTILKEIADLKLAREGELEYCQDPDTADGINAMYDVKTADLQAEYDALV